MSHNVTLAGIKFKDINVLKLAFAELQRDNAAAKGYEFIDTPSMIRGWAGQSSRVDVAIKCPGQKYDIGFNRDKEGNLVPFMEHGFCANGLGTEAGAKAVDGKVCAYGHENRALGQLQQRYAVITAERNARAMGSMTRRIAAADGQIQLEVVHR